MPDRNPLYDFGDEGEGEAPTFNEKWGNLPVEAPRFNLTPNVALVESTPKPLKQGTDPVTGRPDLKFVPVDDPWANTPKPIKRLLGVGGEERYQTWPERALRSGLSAPLDALTGKMQVNDPETGMPTDEAIRRSQDVASVGGPGGLMNLREEGVLGSHGGNLVQPTPKVASPFYSAVEHAVSNIKQDKMPADQWLGTLTNSKGVKPEELDWTGLKDHLAEKGKEPVTKQEVQDYVNANKVELKEVNKGEPPSISVQQAKELANKGLPFHAVEKANPEKVASVTLDNGQILPWVEKNADKFIFRPGTFEDAVNRKIGTKYSQYQLPGGEPGSYKEMLMTLPNRGSDEARMMKNFNLPIETTQDVALARRHNSNFRETFKNTSDEQVLKAAKEAKTLPDWQEYKSTHWDEPNVLAHVRTNDRNITAPGETTPKKSLHIEEIQSDFLQAHRNEQAKIVDAVNKDFDSIADRMVKAGVIKKMCDE